MRRSKVNMSFDQIYRCYPASFVDKAHVENGDKVIMPASALDRLASLEIDYPMLFELKNTAAGRVSHCGVLEFTAEEGMINMPYWMMENLLLQEGDFVKVKNASLPKGTFVKLQPHTKDFLDFANPKAVLETTLRNFSCLSTGDSIMVAYNNKKYYIDVIESKPTNAISVIETDCEVDFAPPLDYKEPAEKPSQPLSTGGKSLFTGAARRLDGEPVKFGSSTQGTPSRQTQGKLVFGSNANRPRETQKETPKEEAKKSEKAKFQAFTGKKYSLLG